jgi:Carboxypeptidase regulatory-like domain/TonB-dependent Receptor Plug Domain
MRTLCCRLLFGNLLLTLLLVAPRLAAAQNTGSIAGTIVDNTSQVIPGATVLLVNERTADARSSTSGPRGEFAFQAVPPGSYTVKVELTGFRTLERRNNVLNANGQLDLGALRLDVGMITEVVSVVAEGSVVETRNSDYSGLLTATQISQIQTKGRDVMSLLRLLPGVRYENEVDAMGDSFGTQVPNIGGNRRAWNQVTVDGLNGNELSGTARFSSAINLDAIAEVKVLLNTYKAEFGRSGGANIQIVSKSGSTDYHGSGYWYARRDEWNATPWENNRTGVEKPKYHFDTYGANLGGPVRIPKLVGNGSDKKLFFFYSLEAPQVQRPGPLRLYRMPTELERRGDFSQTRDINGNRINIRDPLLTGACTAAVAGPACFPGNVIPSDRIDPNTKLFLDMLPLPNRLDHNATANWNFTRQETADNPRWNNLLRIDARPSANDAYWGTLRTFNSNQYGSEITAGPPKWGFYEGSYIFSDSSITGGWNKIFGPRLVNELQTGIRRQTEGFQTHNDSDWARLRRADVGWTLRQFFPQANPLGLIPRATFGLAITDQTDSPDFTYPDRLGDTAEDWLYSVRDNITWTRGSHTFKAGAYYEFMHNNEARGGNWAGTFTFNNNTNNPLNTNHAFSNALLGVFGNYEETETPGSTRNRAWMSEWYVQDTWAAGSHFTVDYGARFLWYAPYWRVDDRVSNFDPARYDPAQAPRLYQPALINNARVAFDPVTGQVLHSVFIGAYVPGTGNQENGLISAGQGASRSFRDRLAPQIEPRLGVTWDLTGSGTTVLHSSVGLFHNARLGGGSFGNLRNPPFFVTPALPNATVSTMFAPGVSLTRRPPNIQAITWDYESPSSYNWSAGVRRDIGWGTVVDATYTGSAGRHLEGQFGLNDIPEGARWLDVNPQNDDPGTAGLQVLPAEFLRPYRGYGTIRVRGNYGTSDYHSFQLQANRRYIRGVQFGGSYTWQRARGTQDEDGDAQSTTLSRPLDYFYSVVAQSQTHAVVINYTWDLPQGNFANGLTRAALNGWKLSGVHAFITGEWAPVMFTTTDNFEFTGGEGSQGQDVNGIRLVRPNVTGNPNDFDGSPITGWFNTAAFSRPAGRGDIGNSPRNVVQRPGINNWDLAIFKDFRAGGTRTFQLRAEAYNLLNHTQFIDIDRTARFDATGTQINPNFGTAIGINSPTRPPRIIQLSARMSF